MDDARITRIETRVDEIKDAVSKVEAKQEVMSESIKEIREDFHEHTHLVKQHVAGDTKIIQEIQPLLSAMPHLTELAEEFKYQKMKKQDRKDLLTSWSKKLGLVSLVLAIFVSISKLL